MTLIFMHVCYKVIYIINSYCDTEKMYIKDFQLYIPVFCLSKYETAFGNFFSATYNNDFSDADQAKQPNWAEQTKKYICKGVKNH